PLGATAAAGKTAGGAAAYGLGSVDRVAHGSSVRFAPCYNHEVWSSHGFIISSSDCSGLSLHRHGNGIREANGVFFFLRGELAGAGSFGDYRPAAEFMSTNSNRHELDIRPGMGSSSSGSGAASVATRRRTEERVGGNAKKSKQEASRKASPPKAQAPKVKLGEKITALQQIVSPFGKTDTSSVLFETIKYIKFLHEQLRLFSEPYMTKSAHKGRVPFGGEEKDEKRVTGHERGLRGRGLCLVPVSLHPAGLLDAGVPELLVPVDELREATGCISNRMHKDLRCACTVVLVGQAVAIVDKSIPHQATFSQEKRPSNLV
ncbi:hypothetical protein PVAP13_7NG286672, partial [Panicum virgatum]